MVIGNYVITTSRILKRKLKKSALFGWKQKEDWEIVFALYSARILGICIYRTINKMHDDKDKLLHEINKEHRKK